MKKTGVLFCLLLLLCCVVAPVTAGYQTTEVTIVKVADDGSTVLDERTVDYHWMEENLPVIGDGVTHYYMQGPTFQEDNLWDPEEMDTKSIDDYEAMRGTDVQDLCNLVGGMGPDDIIYISPNDNYGDMKHPYKNVYYTDTENGGNPEQGPLVLTWWRPDDGYPPGYKTGMRTFFFATTQNAKGQYVFGNDDMRRFLDEEYWTRYDGFPCSRAQCQKYVKKITIKSHEPVLLFGITIAADQTSGYLPVTVQFTGATEAASPTAWHWDFGDNTTADVQNPSHKYEKAGVFDVSLTVTAGGKTATATRHRFISAQERPVATTLEVLPPSKEVVIGGTQSFTAVVRDQNNREMDGVAVVWSSSNTTVGTIGTDGLFRALSEGKTTITASAGDVAGVATAMVVALPPEPKTWYVADDGTADFTSIQTAVSACNPGDTIVVKDGTYSESVIVDRAVTVRSENGAETTIVKTPDVRTAPMMVTAENVTIEGLTVKGGIIEGTAGIAVDHADGCTLRGIRATENYHGVFLNVSAGTLLSGIITDVNQWSGIAGTGSDGTVIEGCTAEANARQALLFSSSVGLTIRGCSISSEGEAAHGVILSRVDNAQVVQNTLKHLGGRSSNGLTISSSRNLIFEENTVSSYTNSGMSLGGLQNATVSGNTVSGGFSGISVSGEQIMFRDNRVSDAYHGLSLSTTNSIFTNNTCVRNDAVALKTSGDGNNFYLNNLLEKSGRPGVKYTSWLNAASADNTASTPEPVDYIYNGTQYHGYLGNYWFDYEGTDADGDGIGEVPYNASETDHDFYPLTAPASEYEILPPVETIVHGPYITGTTGTETTISWKTDVPTIGRVDYAIEADYLSRGYGRSVASEEESLLHHVRLTGLMPGMTYHYQVTAGRNVTQDYHFETFPETGRPFTFIVYGDSQEQIPYYTQMERHKIVADRIAEEEGDALFVLHLGDTVSQAQDPTEWDRFFASAKPMLANTTLYTALGNHEEDYKALATETFALPQWYSFDCGDLHVVVLDSTSMRGSEMVGQTAWLRDDLATDEARWTIGAFHHPPHNSGGHHASAWPDEGWHAAFEEIGTDVIFNGHVHSYQRHLVNGTQFVIAATGGGMQYPLEEEKKPGYQAGMEYVLGYERVQVNPADGTMTMAFVKVADVSENNRNVTAIYPPDTLFDPVVIGLPADPVPVAFCLPEQVYAGEANTIGLTVTNQGGGAADDFTVTLSAEGTVIGSETVSAGLEPGESTELSFVWTPASASSYELTATLISGEEERILTDTVSVIRRGGSGSEMGTLELASGWNFVSTPKRLASGSDTAAVFESVGSAGHSVLKYDAGAWQALGSEDAVRVLDGIWVYSAADATLNLTYDSNPRQIPAMKPLTSGWNAIGFSDVDSAPATDALVSLTNWSSLVGYDANTQAYELAARPSDAAIMSPGQGYWLCVDTDGSLAAIGA